MIIRCGTEIASLIHSVYCVCCVCAFACVHYQKYEKLMAKYIPCFIDLTCISGAL